jgi:hypothetical protein
METMYYIGLNVHQRTISYCVKDMSGRVYAEGSVPATRFDLDGWMKTLPQPWTAAIKSPNRKSSPRQNQLRRFARQSEVETVSRTTAATLRSNSGRPANNTFIQATAQGGPGFGVTA